MSDAAVPVWAAGVCDGLHAAGVSDIVYVPDNPLSHVLRDFGARFPQIRLVLATREEEAFGIAAGLYLGGRRAAVLLQSSGVGNSLNALTTLLIPYEIPVPMVVSMRGDVGEWNPAQTPMGRGIRSVFDAIGVSHVTVDSAEAAADSVSRLARSAFESRTTRACLLPRLLTTTA
ncbi:MAG TPA: thiamine pyrophosphate-binding protein [Vicinamibacterales bacterium]|nr:thiamine pyrophosphate-binding protein [Vicinamibacterales bacterium]